VRLIHLVEELGLLMAAAPPARYRAGIALFARWEYRSNPPSLGRQRMGPCGSSAWGWSACPAGPDDSAPDESVPRRRRAYDGDAPP